MTTTGAERLGRETPAWFDEAKLGLFVTWSAAAIPGYAPLVRIQDLWSDNALRRRLLPHAEMYQFPLNIPDSPTQRYHAATYGERPYDSFVEQFRDETLRDWDPGPWADLFALSGARYVNLCTKVEDGFLLWPSAHANPRKQRWQSERDVVGELAAALRARDIRFGAYYCGGVDWTYRGLPGGSDGPLGSYECPTEQEYLRLAEAHWRELIDRYEPSVLWNDYTPAPGTDLARLFGDYWERVPDGVVNNRFDGNPFKPSEVHDDFLTPEYTTEGSPVRKWEACRGFGLSFGFNRQESESTYLSATELLHLFIDIVARGGNMLLSVSPTGAGEVPWLQVERLLTIGQWLRVNGRAIYGTRPWERHAGVTGDGLGVRYTSTPDALYAIVLGTPQRAELEIDVSLDHGAIVSLEGRAGSLEWRSSRYGVQIELPERPSPQPALVLRIEPASAAHPWISPVEVFEEVREVQ